MYRKNKIDHVICVGDQKDDKEVCKKAGASWVEYKNKPLGEKWNAGFLKAKDYNPDAVLYVGSSDWVSDNWIEVTEPFLNKFDIVGKTDFNMLHYGKERKVVHWTGYQAGSWREHEPIGIGRMLSAKFMEKVNWQPVASELNNSMDGSMIQKLNKCGGSLFLFNSIEIQSLSLSCDEWSNLHKENIDKSLPNTYPIFKPEFFLKTWFPEAMEL